MHIASRLLILVAGSAIRILAADSQPLHPHPASMPMPGREPHAGNPILPGYYADPSLLQHEGRAYIYATLDPWGGDTLGCWESENFTDWTYRVLDWPTEKACTSPESGGAKVWAPSVVRGTDGRFHMYVSVGNEVWAGIADSPTGPWRNPLGDKPLVPKNYKPGFHMIDAEAFIDDDGSAYLYWGSGLNWTNGRCWVVKLGTDMCTFAGEVKDVTPAHYFEGPFLVKRGGRYFLMNSTGRTVGEDYEVHYAVGASPFGPFTEPAQHLILASDRANHVISPGHHAVFRRDGQDYILYHRHSIPFDRGFIGRQTCVDRLVFTDDGRIEIVTPTHAGPPLVQGRRAKRIDLADGAVATASSSAAAEFEPRFVLDGNYATRWTIDKNAKGGWLQLDLGLVKTFARSELRFEYAWKSYRFTVEASDDGTTWKPIADKIREPATGSPVVVDHAGGARYLRLVFPEQHPEAIPALFEWAVY